MNVKEAVTFAKHYVADLFSDEQIQDLGLEEVEFDGRGAWVVTIGFTRPWHLRHPLGQVIGRSSLRDYKIVRISDTKKEVISVKDRAQVG